jgi:hypothetical protein
MDSTLCGYNERKLGYGSVLNQWSYPDTTDPDYPTRYSDLKDLLCAGYPIQTLLYTDPTHEYTHWRVLKGYDDVLGTFIFHDPWIYPPYSGPDLHIDQEVFVDDTWTYWHRHAQLFAPWEVSLSAPDIVEPGEEFTLTADVHYRSPHPFGATSASDGRASLSLPRGFALVGNKRSARSLGTMTWGMTESVSWDLVRQYASGSGHFRVEAVGVVTSTATSYPTYTDTIGGVGTLVVGYGETDEGGEPVRDGPASPPALRLAAPRPNPFRGACEIAFELPVDAAPCELSVYDLAGRLVRRMGLDAGADVHGTATWDGRDETGAPVDSGVYFFSLEVSGDRDVQKVVLLR